MKTDKLIIGRWDFADFVDFNIEDLPVKIDTGAYTSSIRCSYIEEIDRKDGKILRYTILREDHPIPIEQRVFETENYSTRIVRNSGGKSKMRYKIQTTVRMFGQDHIVDFTLAKRKRMKFPVLLGRKFLGNKFLVDPSKAKLSFNKKKNIPHQSEQR